MTCSRSQREFHRWRHPRAIGDRSGVVQAQDDDGLHIWQYHAMSGVTSSEVAKLRDWLATHGFTQSYTGQAEPGMAKQQLWMRNDCEVRLLQRRQGVWVQVRHRADATGWLDLDECVALRGGLSAAPTISPIELATTPPHGRRRSKRWAHGVKVALQMAVGAGAVGDLGWHVAYALRHHQDGAGFTPLATGSVEIIAGALAVAAGVELAYTLYTPGPDEALDPLMLGLSSGLLLLVTRDEPNLSVISQFLAVLVGVLALGALFLIRRHLLEEDAD